MKVKELIKKLKAVDGNKEVYASIDSEGNGFHKVGDISEHVCEEEHGHVDISMHISEFNDEIRKLGYTEDDFRDGETSIILWP